MTIKVAVVQKPPVLLDLEATLARALESLDEAAAAGAGSSFSPRPICPATRRGSGGCGPAATWRCPGDIHARLHKNAVDIAAGDWTRSATAHASMA